MINLAITNIINILPAFGKLLSRALGDQENNKY
jgi:hypothetical protein